MLCVVQVPVAAAYVVTDVVWCSPYLVLHCVHAVLQS